MWDPPTEPQNDILFHMHNQDNQSETQNSLYVLVPRLCKLFNVWSNWSARVWKERLLKTYASCWRPLYKPSDWLYWPFTCSKEWIKVYRCVSINYNFIKKLIHFCNWIQKLNVDLLQTDWYISGVYFFSFWWLWLTANESTKFYISENVNITNGQWKK